MIPLESEVAVEVYYALAADLLDPDLLRGPAEGPVRDPADRPALAILHRLPLPDQAARDALRESRARFPTLADKLSALASFVVVDPSRPGRAKPPARVLSPEVQRVVRLVEPDILAVCRLLLWAGDVHRPSDAELAWPAGLWRADSSFESLCGERMAETHLHLGGAVPSGLLWVDLLGNRWYARERFAAFAERSQGLWSRALRRVDEALVGLGYLVSSPDRASRGRSALGGEDRGPPPTRLTTRELRECARVLRAPAEPGAVEGGLEDVALGLVGYRLLLWERRLLWDALSRLRDVQARDPAVRGALERPLLDWVRVRNSFHYVLVHQEGGRGLGRFLDAFDRRGYHATPSFAKNRHHTRAIERRRMSMALDAVLLDAAQDLPGAARLPATEVELRVHLELGGQWREQLQAWSGAIVRTLERWQDPPLKVGLIHHFLRGRSGAGERARVEAERLQVARITWPGLNLLLLAVDGAGPEVDGGPRAFAEAVRVARRPLRPPRPPGPPLRVTWHAGEDFRDLLTGVRSIHEAIHLLDMGADGRIGHGLALGWNSRDFYLVARRGPPKLGEHVLDLLWLANLFRTAGATFDALGQRAERRLEDLLSSSGIDELRALFNSRGLVGVDSLPGGSTTGAASAPGGVVSEAALLDRLGVRPELRDRLHWFDPHTNGHLELVDAAQDLVAGALSRLGVTLELNPTSNTLIGGFGSPVDLPYRRFCRLPSEDGRPTVRFSINTDDPGLFLNWLRAEHVYVGETWARQRPGDRGSIEDWLRAGIKEGLRSSFFERVHPEGRELREWLVSLRSPTKRAPTWS